MNVSQSLTLSTDSLINFVLMTEWVMHMLTYPRHLLVTCFVRASEQLGLFRPHHPMYKVFVSAVEFVGII